MRNQTDEVYELRVLARRDEAEGIISLDLAAPEGVTLSAFEAGAHVEVHLEPGLARPYSLCGDPADTTRYRLGVLLEAAGRGGSAAVHRELIQGRTIRVSAPRNSFRLVEAARHTVLIAGGIGVTPMLAMAYRLQTLGRAFDLHYCTRSHSRTAFTDDIARASFATRVHIHHDDGPADQRLNLVRDLPAPRPDVHLYVCGPKGFMDWVIGAARAAGWQSECIHCEYFSAEVDTSGGGFTVEARRSGKTFTVAPGQSIAAMMLEAGIDIPLSCEQGVCGTCLVDVIEGTPDHRDQFQTDEERLSNKQITPCCSRSLSPRLVLDI